MQELGEFSVFQDFSNGMREKVRDRVTAGEAVRAAAHYSDCVGSRIGTTVRVIITDGDDFICWEWLHGRGVVFPPPAAPDA